MQVICLEEVAFYELVEQVVAHLQDKHSGDKERWVSDEQAMQLLKIKSKTNLQQLRDGGKIRFSQPQKRSSYTTGYPPMPTWKKTPPILFSHERV